MVFGGSTYALDKSITESYAKVQAAIIKKDIPALKQIWQSYVDLSCIEDRKGKKLNYKQLIDQIEPQIKAVKKVNSCKVQILDSKTKGQKTICTVQTTQSVIYFIRGKDSLIDVVSTVEDTWQKVNGKYKIVGIKTIKETIKQDGKVIQAE